MAGLLEAVEHRLFGLPLGVSDAQAPLMQVKVVLVGAFSFDRHRLYMFSDNLEFCYLVIRYYIRYLFLIPAVQDTHLFAPSLIQLQLQNL